MHADCSDSYVVLCISFCSRFDLGVYNLVRFFSTKIVRKTLTDIHIFTLQGHDSCDDAAIRIQANFRGFRARQEYKKVKENLIYPLRSVLPDIPQNLVTDIYYCLILLRHSANSSVAQERLANFI